jgi:hypothetical protein
MIHISQTIIIENDQVNAILALARSWDSVSLLNNRALHNSMLDLTAPSFPPCCSDQRNVRWAICTVKKKCLQLCPRNQNKNHEVAESLEVLI